VIFEPIVIDDALPEFIFNKIQSSINDRMNMPWFYLEGTAYGDKDLINNYLYQGSFMHLFMAEYNYNSQLAPILEASLAFMAERVDVNLKRVFRIRAGLIPAVKKYLIHDPHVDGNKTAYTGLLYINDSDGDTYLYNEILDKNYNGAPEEYYVKVLNKKVTLRQKIKPKANRFVCFDSRIYHSSSTPVLTQNRIVINFNFD